MLKLRFRLKAKTGFLPGTTKVEERENRIRKEYEKLLEYEQTGEPARFMELDELINSREFREKKKEINNRKFSDTEAYDKLMAYRELKKSKPVAGYFRFISNPFFGNFTKIEASDDIKKFQELEQYVQSGEFRRIKKMKFEDTEAYEKFKEYKKIKKSPDINDYFTITSSQDFDDFRETENSEKLAGFRELEMFINSSDFQAKKKVMSASEFKQTEDNRKYEEYIHLKKDPKIKAYFKLVSSKAFANYKILADSAEIKEYEKLEKFITSGDYEAEKNKFEIEKAAALHKEKEYKNLKKSSKYKKYFKLKESKDYEYYRQLDNSDKIKEFLELEKYVQSDEFKELEKHMKSRDKFKKSPEYQQLVEYEQLKKSRKIKWYFKLKESSKFDEIKKWELVFSDNFNSTGLNPEKWLTTYFWGKNLLNDSYSLASDPHYFTVDKNFEIKNGILKLYTKKEKVTGKAWDPSIGFFQKDFDFTSAMINTGESLWQKYGAFEAKVKLNASPSVYHAFWMVQGKMVPHLNVFRFSGDKSKQVNMGGFWQEKPGSDNLKNSESVIKGVDFSKGFYIFRLEWTPDEIIWKINNMIVKKERISAFSEPMYMILSSGITGNAIENNLPVSFDIDWIKVYKPAGRLVDSEN